MVRAGGGSGGRAQGGGRGALRPSATRRSLIVAARAQAIRRGARTPPRNPPAIAAKFSAWGFTQRAGDRANREDEADQDEAAGAALGGRRTDDDEEDRAEQPQLHGAGRFPDPQEDFARRLIVFAFADGKQDYDFWISVPYFAKRYGPAAAPATLEPFLEPDEPETEEEAAAPTYTVDQIVGDGCFLPPDTLSQIISRVQAKKNLVLQGPPGTGKTWLAKRLRVCADRIKGPQGHARSPARG